LSRVARSLRGEGSAFSSLPSRGHARNEFQNRNRSIRLLNWTPVQTVEQVRQQNREPPSLATGIALLFIGLGMSAFLFLTHSWFSGVVTTGLTILVTSTSVLVCLSRISPNSPSRTVTTTNSRVRKSRLPYAVLLAAWVAPLWFYIASGAPMNLAHQSELARAYGAYPSCQASVLRELARHTPNFDAPRGDQDTAIHAICRVGWSRITAKSSFHYCLSLAGSGLDGVFCSSTRRQPHPAWGNIRVGEAVVAQTAYGHPSSYLYQSDDIPDRIFDPHGVLFESSTNPDQMFDLHFVQAFIAWSFYLCLGALAVFQIFD